MMETMTDEYVDYMADSGSSADQIVAGFHAIDERVNAMREQRLNDPDSLGDKLIKYFIPTLAGLVAGRLFRHCGTAVRRAPPRRLPARTRSRDC